MRLINKEHYTSNHTYKPSELPKPRFKLTGAGSPTFVRAMVYDENTKQMIATISQQMIPTQTAKLITNQDDEVHQTFSHTDVDALSRRENKKKEVILVHIDYAFTFPNSPPEIESTPPFYLDLTN
jgi:hypothetical protein